MPGSAGLLLILSALLGEPGRGMPEESHPSPLLAARSEEMWVVFHREDQWQMAFTLAPNESPGALNGFAHDGLLPPLERPKLLLYAPYFRSPAGRVWKGEQMAVDVAEHLFKAQLLFLLQQEVAATSEYGFWAKGRANVLFDQIEPEHRLGAYLEAISDFGAHLLSMANEIRRHMERARARGVDPCRLLAPTVPLARLWAGSFGTEGYYPGGYWQEPTLRQSTGSWRMTRKSLAKEDKTTFLRQILKEPWHGDASRDLASLCRGPGEPSP